MSEELIEKIRLKAAEQGIDSFGVCFLSEAASAYPEMIGEFENKYKAAIVMGIPLPSASLDDITNAPTPIYMHHYRQLNYILDRYAMQAAIAIHQAGGKALTIPASQITSWKPIPKGHISHKLLAFFAGLGWRGRNNLLVTKNHGSRIRLVSILTDLDIEWSSNPVNESCGNCQACISDCPAEAIKENPEDFDINACSEKLTEFQRLPLIGQRICGICVKSCRPKEKNI